jgi:hypothetical protein
VSAAAAIELTPNWVPLEAYLGPLSAEFMWMYRTGGIEHYKHIRTRRYLLLDAQGQCFERTNAGLRPVPFVPDWMRVSGREEGI